MECKVCNIIFIRNSANQIYCGGNCKRLAINKIQKDRKAELRKDKKNICKVCNKEYPSAKNKTCSIECRTINNENIKTRYYLSKVKPFLPGRQFPLLTDEQKKLSEFEYNNSPERKLYMQKYSKTDKYKESHDKSVKKKPIKYKMKGKDNHLKRTFGITLEQYNELSKSQNNLCAICLNPESTIHKKNNKLMDLAVDHCHETGKIRGLLCWTCNTSLGKFKDSIENLERAIEYLKKSREE